MAAEPQRRLEVVEIGDVTVVRWDSYPQWPDAADQLFKLADGSRRRRVVLNFANVDSLASIVLAKLMSLHKKLQAGGGTLVLCGVSPRVREVFDITRVGEFFAFQAGEPEALQALTAATQPAGQK